MTRAQLFSLGAQLEITLRNGCSRFALIAGRMPALPAKTAFTS